MEIRYSPYNSPFIPSDAPPGIYWIGRELRDAPHSAHVELYYRLLDSNALDVALLRDLTVFSAAGRWFATGMDLSGRPRTFWVSERHASELQVAALVTPPLCPMGGTFHPKSITKRTDAGVCS